MRLCVFLFSLLLSATVAGQCSCYNTIFSESFSTTTRITSDYRNTGSCPEPFGTYGIGSTSRCQTFSDWYVADRLTPWDTIYYDTCSYPCKAILTGSFAMFDPSKAGTVYSVKVNVLTGTWYSFSFYVKNLNPIGIGIPAPIIGVRLNGTQYLSCDTIKSNSWTVYDTASNHLLVYGAADWKQLTVCWYSAGDKTVTFEIYYCDAGETGYDLALDDIAISQCSSALPVEFLYFYCKDNTLYWATASETNSDYFTISVAGIDESFSEIGRVKAAGQSIIEQRYSYILKDKVYYARLSQTDFSGNKIDYKPIYIDRKGYSSNYNFLYALLTNQGIYNILGQAQ